MRKIQILTIVLLTVLAYSNIFVNQFATDDVGYFQNWDIPRHFSNLPKIFTRDSVPREEAGVYRPIKALAIMISYHLWGVRVFGYHLVSLLVHLANTVLVFLIVEQISLGLARNGNSVYQFKKRSTKVNLDSKSQNSVSLRPALASKSGSKSHVGSSARSVMFLNWLTSLPFLTALLFGLHPIHTEAVTFMLAAYDAIGFMFFLASFLFYLRGNRWVSVIFAALAFFSYELTLTLPFLLILVELTLGRLSLRDHEVAKQSKTSIRLPRLQLRWTLAMTRRYIPYFLVLAFYLFVRFFLLHLGMRGSYLGDSFIKTMLVMSKAFVLYLWLFIWPFNLSLDHQVLPGVYSVIYKSFSDDSLKMLPMIEIVSSLCILIALVVLALFSLKKRPIITFAIFWFFICLLPAAFILPQSTIMAERYVYLAVLWFCLLAAWVVCMLVQSAKFKVQSLGIILAVILVLSYGTRTYLRNRDWKDTLTVWLTMGKQNSGNFITNYTIGKIYLEKNQPNSAEVYFTKALALEPASIDVNFRLGKISETKGEYGSAANYFESAAGSNSRYSTFAKWELSRLQRMSQSEGSLGQKDVWGKYTFSPVSFEYPKWWIVTRDKDYVFFDDPENLLTIEFSADTIKSGDNAQAYLQRQGEVGTLVKISETKIDHFDTGHVLYFKDDDIERLKFFLFKKDQVLRIQVYPLSSSGIKEFDRMIGTMESN